MNPDPPRPRCTTRGCPTRYRGGPDRACPEHAYDADTDRAVSIAAEELGFTAPPQAAELTGYEADRARG